MKPRRRLLIATALLGPGLLPSSGCGDQTVLELRRRVTQLEKCLGEKDNQLVAQRVTVEKLHEQIDKLRGWTDEDLERIFYPERIEIASLSGGDDYDGKPGDDGVTVYLRPLDRDGDAVKVAGDIRVQLYDLENPSDQNLIGEYYVPVDQVAQCWYGRLATYHYTIRCPWQTGPPAHDQITIRATFVDYLTQRAMTAQTVCTINPVPR